MKYDFLGVIVFGIVLLIGVAVIAAFITVVNARELPLPELF